MRQSIELPFDCYQFTFLFNHFEMSKDFLRELFYKLNEHDRKDFEKDILIAATIVRILSNEYLQNAILYIENNMIEFYRDDLEYQHALAKFKYRLDYQLHPEKYKETTEYYITGRPIGKVIEDGKVIDEFIM